jgi:hypothetical protein
VLFSQTAKQHQLAQKSHHRLLEVRTHVPDISYELQNYNLIKHEPKSLDLQLDLFKIIFLEKVSFLQCALRMDSSGQNSIFKRQNRELDPFWPWWLVPAINRTARHTSQANMGSRDIHKLVLVISFQDF